MTIAIAPPKQVFSDPLLFASALLKIKDKRQRLIPLRYNRAQQLYLANRTKRDLILKARQIGISTMIQAELYRLATTRPVSTLTLGNDDDNTSMMRRISQTFQDNMPESFPPTKLRDNAKLSAYQETGSQAMIATAGNKDSGRGGTYTQIHGSEVAFWPDARKTMEGAMQGGDPAIVLESTANGAQGYFYDLCMEAQGGDSNWRLHFFPWWILPEYRLPLEAGEGLDYTDEEMVLAQTNNLDAGQIKWRRHKQKDLGRAFLQEYPEDPNSCFLRSGVGFFGALEDVFTAPEGATYQAGHKYYAGVDWGQVSDYTVLSVWDAETYEQVELLRMRQIPWPTMKEKIAKRLIYWKAQCYAEKNAASSNVGDLRALVSGSDASVRPFNTSSKSKTKGINLLYNAFYDLEWKLLPDANQMAEMRAYEAKQTVIGNWQYSAPAGMHDDTVIANMLAAHGACRPRVVGGFDLSTGKVING